MKKLILKEVDIKQAEDSGEQYLAFDSLSGRAAVIQYVQGKWIESWSGQSAEGYIWYKFYEMEHSE